MGLKNRITILVASACFCSSITTAQIKNMKIEGKITATPTVLGESTLWDFRDNSLYWIDIEGKKVHQYFPETKKDIELVLPKRLGTVILTEKEGTCIVALEDTLAYASITTKKIDLIGGPSFEGKPVRFNDGKCDPNGNFWIGTVDQKNYSDPIAKLYKVEKDKTFTVEIDGVTISNGICWSPDGKKMYYIDSPKRTVVAYDFDLSTSKISNPDRKS